MMFGRAGSFSDSRTNQTDLDNLMLPCLDFDDDDKEDQQDSLFGHLEAKPEAEDKGDDEPETYNLAKLNSIGQSSRPKGIGVVRRYSEDDDEEEEVVQKPINDSDSDDDDLDRGGDSLSLQELDGWMNEINTTDSAQPPEQEYVQSKGSDEEISPGQEAEAAFLQSAIEMVKAERNDDDDDEEDELGLDFIARV